MPSVDFVVNCYERTYHEVLQPGFLRGLVDQQRFPFESVTVLINNVDSRDAVRAMADRLVASGEVSRVEFVADHIGEALRLTNLRPRHIRRLSHFWDYCLVAATIGGPDWFVYWDPEAGLRAPMDWITPVLDYMSTHPTVLIGNPNNWFTGLAERESTRVDHEYAIGFGCSDVALLARRSDLRADIYRKFSPASWRYVLAHIEPIFEQRVDAWMRRTGRERVTYLPAVYEHRGVVGASYPDGGLRGRLRRKVFSTASPILASVSSHPAMRAFDPTKG